MGLSVNIRNAIVKGILDAGLPYKIQWFGGSFTKPAPTDSYLRVNYYYNKPFQDGYKFDSIKGFVQIDIYTPKDDADLTAAQIEDELKAAFPVNFAGFTSGDVKVQFSSVGRVGVPQDGMVWNSTIVQADFYVYADRNG